MKKPDTRTAMYQLIRQVRTAFPFDASETSLCSDECSGCSKKLLEFVSMELDDWETKLDDGARPGLADLDRMARTCRKVYEVLQRNELID